MHARNLNYDHDKQTQGMVIMDKPEYVSTKDAARILKVNSTQAVRYLMEQYPDKLPGFNFGSDMQPRWMLRRADVINFQLDRADEL